MNSFTACRQSSLPAFDSQLAELLSSVPIQGYPENHASSDDVEWLAVGDDDIDFAAIVKAEVKKRKPDIPGSCVYALPAHV